MKRIANIFLLALITLLLISCGRKITESEARGRLNTHLLERYGEEFEIGYMGRRSDGKLEWYEADIYPSKYNGTVKAYDKYYRENGTVVIGRNLLGEKIERVGDRYGIVKINESTENFYKNKLEELFGENILFVPDTYFNRVMKDYSFENILRVRDEEGIPLVIKGGIYIFGRVENDEDREWYRKQIYEFIQFMKEMGTFEYVSLGIEIIDERSLTNYFDKNRKNLLEAKQKYKTSEEFIKYREKILSNAEEEFNKMSQVDKMKKINSYLKFDFIRENIIKNGDNGYSVLYHTGLVSSKFQRSQLQETGKVNEYNSLSDIKLLDRIKLIYKEYFINEYGDVIFKNKN